MDGWMDGPLLTHRPCLLPLQVFLFFLWRPQAVDVPCNANARRAHTHARVERENGGGGGETERQRDERDRGTERKRANTQRTKGRTRVQHAQHKKATWAVSPACVMHFSRVNQGLCVSLCIYATRADKCGPAHAQHIVDVLPEVTGKLPPVLHIQARVRSALTLPTFPGCCGDYNATVMWAAPSNRCEVHCMQPVQ